MSHVLERRDGWLPPGRQHPEQGDDGHKQPEPTGDELKVDTAGLGPMPWLLRLSLFQFGHEVDDLGQPIATEVAGRLHDLHRNRHHPGAPFLEGGTTDGSGAVQKTGELALLLADGQPTKPQGQVKDLRRPVAIAASQLPPTALAPARPTAWHLGLE